MKQYKDIIIKRITKDCYPEDAKQAICSAFEKIEVCPDACRYFQNAVKMYKWSMEPYFDSIIKMCEKLSAAAEVDKRIGTLVLLLAMTDELKSRYLSKGYSEEMFRGAAIDLRWQAQDCYARDGIWGISYSPWYDRFFDITRLVFGRLQFEMIYAPTDFISGEFSLKAGDPVINVHIPSSGPLLRESCLAAFGMAEKFFKPYFEGAVPFVCSSWLLSPYHSKILPEKSNIRQFEEMFEVVSFTPDSYDSIIRIFKKPYDGNVEALSEDTSLKRAYKNYMLSGGKVGFGVGYLLIKDGKLL